MCITRLLRTVKRRITSDIASVAVSRLDTSLARTSNELAELVAFLASDKAACVSGQVISINGAMT
jgi:NAD(P)-dependent dehydrogenase (short-subunit alcohol dehydrogenase family)